jgi:hypothetical protein
MRPAAAVLPGTAVAPGAVPPRIRRSLGLGIAGLLFALAASSSQAAEWAETPYRGVRVAAFDRRETRRIFGVRGTAVVAFDGYAADTEAVFVLVTARGPCVDSGRLDTAGALPMIRLQGKCRGITGLVLGSTE